MAAVMAELAAILESNSFSSSKRCRDFLEYVVTHALQGESEILTERFLGVELFGRAVDYETATDSIVRVRANDVRRRLAQYYSSEKSSSPVRIDLIAGGYVPEFHWREEAETQPVAALAVFDADEPASPSASAVPPHAVGETESGDLSPARFYQSSRFLWLSVSAVCLVAITLAVFFLHVRPSALDRFWQPVIEASSSPVLSLPTTDTIQLRPDVIPEFNQLKPGQSMKLEMGDVQNFHNWHVSIPVLQATLSVALALERRGRAPLVRMGTDLKMDELRGHPVIAIGSFSNPWTQQNVSGLRFTFDRGSSDKDPPRIKDTFNPSRSWTLMHIFPDPQSEDYAIITRTFDPVTREPFVSLAGLHSFGNQIAGEFISQDSSWEEVARRAPRGWEKMNLQIVLRTKVVGITTSSPQIIDMYFWK